MNTLIEKWAMFVSKYRFAIVFLAIVMAVLSFSTFDNLYFNNSTELFFLEDDPAVIKFNKLQNTFGDNEYISVSISNNDHSVINSKTLTIVKKITDYLEVQEHVNKVSSLSNYQFVQVAGDELNVKFLIDWDNPNAFDAAQLRQIKDIVSNEKLIHGRLITADFSDTLVVAKTKYLANESEHYNTLSNNLRNFISKINVENPDIKFHVFGKARIAESFNTLVNNDAKKLNPLLILLVSVVILLLFRSFYVMISIWLTIIIVVLATIAFQAMMGWAFNIINTILPLIIIIIGMGDSIHIVTEFYRFRKDGLDQQEASKKCIRTVFRPCLYTTITTAVGFLALSVTSLLPIKEFAYLGALGTILAFLFTFTLLPAFMMWSKNVPEKLYSSGSLFKNVSIAMSTMTRKQSRIGVFVIFGILLLGSVLSSKINVDYNYINDFEPEEKIRKDFSHFDQLYGGGANLELMLETKIDGGIYEPAFMKKAWELQTYIESLDETGDVTSIIELLMDINKKMHANSEDYEVVPASRELTAQYILLYEMSGPIDDVTDLITYDGRLLRMQVRIKNMPAIETQEFLDALQAEIDANYNDINVEMTGGMVLFNQQNIYIINGMTQSFLVAAGIIVFIFFVIFRSIRYSFIALLPSLLSLLLSGSLMYVLGIDLSMGTMLIAAMTIGVAIDDSIHILSRYLHNKRNNVAHREAIQMALEESGRAIILTTLILVIGFSILMSASIVTTTYMGLFAAIIMVTALITSIVGIPSMLHYFDKENKNAS